ncbi:MAG: helix-turn-helix transcriptional regulator [Victivallales bacterium]|nr:helix-turn-helix transcriptional regulator [Victivallales bacterium]
MKRKQPTRITLSGNVFGSRQIKAIGYDHILSPISLKTHRHQGFELTFIVSGEVCWLMPLSTPQALKLNGGEMAIIQPNTPHKGQWGIISPSTLFWIILNPLDSEVDDEAPLSATEIGSLYDIFSNAGNRKAAINSSIESLLSMLLDKMVEIECSSTASTFAAASLKTLSAALLLESARVFEGGGEQKKKRRLVSDKAIAFMMKNLSRDISVPDIAESLVLSPAHFSETFKRETGLSPALCLSGLRCDKARELLESTDFTITKICFSLDFSSTQYFAHVFKKHTGMTPKQYRAFKVR